MKKIILNLAAVGLAASVASGFGCGPTMAVSGIASSFPTQRNVQVTCDVAPRDISSFGKNMNKRYGQGWRPAASGFYGDVSFICFEKPVTPSLAGRSTKNDRRTPTGVFLQLGGRAVNDDKRGRCKRFMGELKIPVTSDGSIQGELILDDTGNRLRISSAGRVVLDEGRPAWSIEELCVDAARQLRTRYRSEEKAAAGDEEADGEEGQ